jgi:PII-like signaling protein
VTGGEMLQLRFYFGERDRGGDGPLDAAVMAACARHGVAAAALLRAVEGFGAKQRMRTGRLLTLSEDPPLVAVAVGESERIEALAEEIRGIAQDGLLTLNQVTTPDTPDRVRSSPYIGRESANAPEGGGAREGSASAGDHVRVTIWGPRTGSRSPHMSAVDACHRHGAEAAMVFLGVDGVLDGERCRARFVASNHDVPALTVAVGEWGRIEAALAEVDAAAPLVTVEAVETSRRVGTVSPHGEPAVERKLLIEPPSLHSTPATRVTYLTSEIATSGAHPRYLELIHRLREDGAAGATALRGVWGFRGSTPPHGDRVLALRRDVPILVEAIDAPEAAARWHDLALSFVGEDDVVDSQSIEKTLTLE